jgi:molybdopterin-guanine dinucleotide biosynthesis protein B
VAQDADLGEIARFLGDDYDIILAEGFKQGNAPKIEVHRREVGPPLKNIKKLVAVVTDEPLDISARQFSFDDIGTLVDLLEKGFIEPQRERLSLYVNDIPIPLSGFPRQIIGNVLLAMVSSLKGVGEVRSLQVFLRKNKGKAR